ncbi:MAG TPA: Nif3-like dinuclear metal center hexameric protein [Acholeplasmataceae bacterium]|nr:Nif3-like dinuclear metal center hexameric protein [Acholeplasmataceae bacterium]
MIVKDVVTILDNLYPIENASEFDIGKIGLTIGDENIKLKKILLALDLTEEVANEAINLNANLIITHHPFIFNPITKIMFTSKIGRILNLMFKHQISLYSIHTNLDVGINGVNDTLANILGLENIAGKNERDSFLRTGFITKQTLGEFAEYVKRSFNLKGVRVAGDLNKQIEKVGIVGGSGSFEIYNAINENCDCLITGEVKLHHAQDALFHNLCMIEVNHGVEKFVLKSIQVELEKRLEGKIQAHISKINTDPLVFL